MTHSRMENIYSIRHSSFVIEKLMQGNHRFKNFATASVRVRTCSFS